MIEIKIMFKNGEYGYYKSNANIKDLEKAISDAKRESVNGTFILTEISADKRTLVDIQEITTFGYSTVES